MRGRVSAVNRLFIGASNELGEFESGLTAAWFGTVPAVVIGGVRNARRRRLWPDAVPEPACRSTAYRISRLPDASARFLMLRINRRLMRRYMIPARFSMDAAARDRGIHASFSSQGLAVPTESRCPPRLPWRSEYRPAGHAWCSKCPVIKQLGTYGAFVMMFALKRDIVVAACAGAERRVRHAGSASHPETFPVALDSGCEPECSGGFGICDCEDFANRVSNCHIAEGKRTGWGGRQENVRRADGRRRWRCGRGWRRRRR